jgi:hypothetical protein
MQNRWTLGGTFGGVEVRLHPGPLDTEARDASVRELRPIVHAFTHRDRQASRVLLELYARLNGVPALARREELDLGSPRARAIGDEIVAAARAGWIEVRPRTIRSVILQVEGELEEETVLGPEPEPTAWIEIELLDEQGVPVPGAEYRIECEDGRVRTGTTNARGRAREEGLRDGTCAVCFPGLDSPEWKAA